MTRVPADLRKILEVGASFAAALAIIGAMKAPAQAAGAHMLIIPASDGYGYDDCLAAGNKACGQVIADAWCEAHGMAAAVSFGRADDVTATMPAGAAAPPAPKIDPRAFIVNCRD